MAALAANYNRLHKEAIGEKELKVKGSTQIFRGSGAMEVIGTGYAIPAADTLNGRFSGVALFEADNSAGADGDIRVKLMEVGEFVFTLTGVTIADRGKKVYVVSDNEVCLTGQTNDVVAGIVSDVYDTNLAWIDIGKRFTAETQAHITDPAACDAMTAAEPGACGAMTQSAYAASTTLTDPPTKAEMEAELALIDTATDETIADTTALKTAIDANKAEIDAAVVDFTALKVAVDINNGKIDALLVALEKAKIVKTA